MKCPKCNGEEFKIINVEKSVQKELKVGYLLLFILFALVAFAGIAIILYNAIELTLLEVPTLKDDDEIIATYISNLIMYEQCKAKIYLGIGLFFLGFVSVIFTAIFYNIDPTYAVKSEARKMCLTCGKKWKLNYETKPEHKE